MVGGGNAILLLLTAMAIVGAIGVAFVASRQKHPAIARTFLGGAAILALLYGGGVVAASVSSSEVTLGPGDTKWFCGFYLDCHLGLSIDAHETVAELPGSNGPLKAKGQFHIITLGLHNSAKNPSVDMLLYRPDVEVVDVSGRRYERSTVAEAALPSGMPASLGAETNVTHHPLRASVVFDLPSNAREPRLIVTEGWIIDRAVELGLIGDENSIFHKRTYLALDRTNPRIAASGNE
jgi:hypothetical protein